MKKWLIYGVIFTVSFIALNAASYYFLVQNKTFKKLQHERAQEAPAESTFVEDEAAEQDSSAALTDETRGEGEEAIVEATTEDTSLASRTSGINMTEQIAKVVEGYESRITDLQMQKTGLEYELEILKREKENRRAEMEEIWTELSTQFLSNLNGQVQELKTLVAKNEAAKASITQQSLGGTKELAKIFDSMNEAAAAPIIARMDDKTAVEILVNLKPRSAADILEVMASDRALAISRLMTAKKSDQE